MRPAAIDRIRRILAAVDNPPDIDRERLADDLDLIERRHVVRVAADQVDKRSRNPGAARKWWRDLQRKTAALLEGWKGLAASAKPLPEVKQIVGVDDAAWIAGVAGEDEDVERLLSRLHAIAEKMLITLPRAKSAPKPYTRARSPLGATIVDISASLFDQHLGRHFPDAPRYSTNWSTSERHGPRLAFIQACLKELGIPCSDEMIAKELRAKQPKKRRPR